MKWSNVCGFQGLSEDPTSLNKRRLISRQVSGPTSNFVPDTEVGVLLRGSSTPYRPSLHSPKPSNTRPSPPSFGAWDSNGLRNVDPGILQSSPCIRYDAVVQKVYATCTSTKNCSQSGLISRATTKTPRFVPLPKTSRLCLLCLFTLS